jgi:hypothetical protein
LQKDKHLKCSHCNRQVQVTYDGESAEVEIAYDYTAGLHIVRKKPDGVTPKETEN